MKPTKSQSLGAWTCWSRATGFFIITTGQGSMGCPMSQILRLKNCGKIRYRDLKVKTIIEQSYFVGCTIFWKQYPSCWSITPRVTMKQRRVNGPGIRSPWRHRLHNGGVAVWIKMIWKEVSPDIYTHVKNCSSYKRQPIELYHAGYISWEKETAKSSNISWKMLRSEKWHTTIPSTFEEKTTLHFFSCVLANCLHGAVSTAIESSFYRSKILKI